MLQPKRDYSSFSGNFGFMHTPRPGIEVSSDLGIYHDGHRIAFTPRAAAANEETETDGADAPLDDAAQSEREYVRGRLREELKREPTEEELDEWLRQHTEGY